MRVRVAIRRHVGKAGDLTSMASEPRERRTGARWRKLFRFSAATASFVAVVMMTALSPTLRAQNTGGEPERLPITIDKPLATSPANSASPAAKPSPRGLRISPRQWFESEPAEEVVVPLTEHDLRQLKTVHASALESTKVVEAQRATDGDSPLLQDPSHEAPKVVDEPLDAAVTSLHSPYRTLFFENDFRYLNHPEVSPAYLSDYMKQMSWGDNWVVDVAGEYRMRIQNEANMRYQDFSHRDDNFMLERTRLYVHARYGETVGIYAEMLDAVSHWENYLPQDVDENRFDMQNLFADALLTSVGDGETWLRVGRQEMLYGSQRLVSPIDWLNTRQTFDGVKGFHRGPTWDVDAFWTHPVDFAQQLGPDHNFNSPNLDRQFYGVYATRKFGDALIDERPGSPQLEKSTYGIDTYYLANTDAVTQLDSHLLGGRAFFHADGWQGDAEAGVQFGRTARGDLAAGFFSGTLLHTFSRTGVFSKAGIGYDWASGDRTPNDGKDGTFQLLYGDFHSYLGYCDLIGRRNIRDLSLQLQTDDTTDEKGDSTFWTIAWHLFQLDSVTDALYNARGVPVRIDPSGSSGSAVGQELDITYRTISSGRSESLVGYSHFYPGSYLRRTTAPTSVHQVDFFYWQWTLRF